MSSSTQTPSDAVRVVRILDGARTNFALATALELHLYEHLASGPATAAELAARAKLSERGTQVLLDASVALDLVAVQAGRYKNLPVAELLLVPSSSMYLGDEYAKLLRFQTGLATRLGESVRTGRPLVPIDDPAVLEFWSVLTPMIARMNRPVAAQAVRELGLSEGAPDLLDVGGGMAVYSLALLAANPRARATQADWPHINEAARGRVAQAGFADRFATIDGDFHDTDLGDARFDLAVLSNVMHQESPESNRALAARVFRSLRPGGHLVVAEYVVDDGRAGPAMALLFHLNMLPLTLEGRSYERREIASFLKGAGFAPPKFVPAGPATLVFSRKF